MNLRKGLLYKHQISKTDFFVYVCRESVSGNKKSQQHQVLLRDIQKTNKCGTGISLPKCGIAPLPFPTPQIKKSDRKAVSLLVNEGALSQINNCVCHAVFVFVTCFFFLDFFSNFYALLKMTIFLLKNKIEIINSYLKLTIVCCSGICTTRGSLGVDTVLAPAPSAGVCSSATCLQINSSHRLQIAFIKKKQSK